MDQVSLNFFPKSHLEFLASTWLQQQDLSGKSPTEIADMYYKALIEVRKHYAQNYAPRHEQPQQQSGRHTTRRNRFEDDW